MFENVVYVLFVAVIVLTEIQYRREKRKVERYESLWFTVVDRRSGELVVNHSLKMLEELSTLGGFDGHYGGVFVEVYRKGEGG